MKIVYPSWFELQFNDNNGKPLSSGRVYTKRSDSGANAVTYNANDAPNSNPVLLDPNGRAVIRLDNTFAYKFIVHDSNDVLVYERDKVYGTEVVVDGGSGTDNHAELSNREADNQHPINATTGLESALNDKVSKSATTTQTMVGGLDMVESGVQILNNIEANSYALNVVQKGSNVHSVIAYESNVINEMNYGLEDQNKIIREVNGGESKTIHSASEYGFTSELKDEINGTFSKRSQTSPNGDRTVQTYLSNTIASVELQDSANSSIVRLNQEDGNNYALVEDNTGSAKLTPTDLAFSDVSIFDSIPALSIPKDTPALDYTGFLTPATVGLTYNPTTRKVTITANGNALYRNNAIVFPDGWESPAHTDADGSYFLFYRDGNIYFQTSPWNFSDLMIAFVYRDGVNVCIRECHGLMPHTAHKEFHETIGTYLSSGLDMSSIVVESTTADNRRPLVSAGIINDEDLPSTISAITVKTDYSKLQLVGSVNPATITQAQTDIIDLSGNNPYWNSFSGGTWGQTLFTANQYGKIFLMAIPATDDAECQKNRLIFVQPQIVSTNLATIQAVSPSSLNLGQIQSALPEYCFVGEIIIRYTASNWVITSFSKLTGTKIAQGSSPVNTTDTQQAYNNSSDGRTTTDAIRGAIKHRQGSGADTDNVLQVENGAGDIKASIKGDGFATVERLRVAKVRQILQDSLAIDSADPSFAIIDTDASADAKRWRWIAQADQLFLSARNDTDTAGSDVLSVTRSGATVTGLNVATKLTTSASTTTRAGFNVPHGTAPTTPANGDMWSTTTGLFIRINGVTKSVNLT